MSKQRENHFVPQFYLRQFSQDSRRINLFNFARMAPIRDASIRGQCSRRNFYGFADGLEQALAQLEAEAATAIHGVCAARQTPEPDSNQRFALLSFIVFQKLRTAATGRRNDTTTDYFGKVMAQSDPELREIDPDTYEVVNKFPVAIPLLQVPRLLEVASDLEMHLFINDTPIPFITSDDPVVLHNRYCEGIDYRGVLGWNCSGIQAIFPASPTELVLLYDDAVYRVGRLNRRHRETVLTNPFEVRLLNALQILNASENVYYKPGCDDSGIEAHCAGLAPRRPVARTRFVETEDVPGPDGTSSSITHMFEPMLPIRFDLASVAIRKRARRISLDRRATLERKHLEPTEEEKSLYDRKPLATRYPVKRSFDR